MSDGGTDGATRMLIGVVLALLLAHAPLGFVAILGVIALSGMIMRNPSS